MADAMMMFLGEAHGVNWYWAQPGEFENPGVYYWDGAKNVLCVPHLAAAPEAPAQASAVDERDRKDAERYRWLREQHWTENLIGVVIRPKDNAKLGSMLPSLELLDDTIDHMKARAALAQKDGK